MYVCICNALNDRTVKSTLAGGARNAAGVYAAHGCRPQCGKCIPVIQEMARTECRGAGLPATCCEAALTSA